MGIVLEVPVDADSAFAHRLAQLLSQAIKGDRGIISDKDSASRYEHLVSIGVDGEVDAEVFVLVITPAGLYEESQGKWTAIADSVRSLLNDGGEVRSLMQGQSKSYQNHSENKVVIPRLNESAPNNRNPQ